jgi:hypothetical protein
MALNLVKLENDLKNAPDQALVGYVQNPNGQVPTYLALSELDRRKRMRQGAQAQQGAQEQPSVAEQLVAESAPPPMEGVASLPVPDDMYSAAQGGIVGYADGGMVAFENGGQVPSYQLGGRVMTPEEFARLTPAQQDAVLSAQAAENKKAMSATRLFSLPQGAAVPQPAPKISGTLPPLTESEFSGYNIPRPQALTGATSVELEQTKKARERDLQQGIATGDVAAPPAPPVAQPQPRAPSAGRPQGLAALAYEPSQDLSGEYTVTPATSAEAERARYMSMMGDDPYQVKAAERLAAMEGRAAEEETKAPWMALAEAGFATAAGDSPFALQNIGKGAQKGLESFAKARERAAAAEEKRFALESDLASKQRAEQVAATTFGLNSEQTQQAREDRQKTEKLAYRAGRESEIASGTFNAKKFNLEYKQREKEIAITAKNAERQIAASINQMDKAMLTARLTSLTTQLEEKNKQIKAATEAMDTETAAQLMGEYRALESALATIGTSGKLVTGAGGKLVYQP